MSWYDYIPIVAAGKVIGRTINPPKVEAPELGRTPGAYIDPKTGKQAVNAQGQPIDKDGRVLQLTDADVERQLRDQSLQRLNDYRPGVAPTFAAPQIDQSQQQQFRAGQLGAMQSYQDVLAGKTPSVAEMQGRQALAQNIGQQVSQAAGARGNEGALARRTAATNIGNLNASAGFNAQLGRAAEQDAARAGLAGASASGRAADEAVAAQDAGLSLASRQANQTAKINTRTQDITQQNNLASQAQNAANAPVNAAVGKATIDEKNIENQQKSDNGLLSLGAAGLTAASDKRLKTDVKSERPDAFITFLRSYDPKSFKYKPDAQNDANPAGTRHGVIAQDLEKTPIGKSLVIEEADGKHLNGAASIGTMLAAMSALNKRLDAMEKR